jgi:DnaJ-class molecular chaperone
MTDDKCETCSGVGRRATYECDDCRGTGSEGWARHFLYGDPRPGSLTEVLTHDRSNNGGEHGHDDDDVAG